MWEFEYESLQILPEVHGSLASFKHTCDNLIDLDFLPMMVSCNSISMLTRAYMIENGQTEFNPQPWLPSTV